MVFEFVEANCADFALIISHEAVGTLTLHQFCNLGEGDGCVVCKILRRHLLIPNKIRLLILKPIRATPLLTHQALYLLIMHIIPQSCHFIILKNLFIISTIIKMHPRSKKQPSYFIPRKEFREDEPGKFLESQDMELVRERGFGSSFSSSTSNEESV